MADFFLKTNSNNTFENKFHIIHKPNKLFLSTLQSEIFAQISF